VEHLVKKLIVQKDVKIMIQSDKPFWETNINPITGWIVEYSSDTRIDGKQKYINFKNKKKQVKDERLDYI